LIYKDFKIDSQSWWWYKMKTNFFGFEVI